jgi:hypothetical protein
MRFVGDRHATDLVEQKKLRKSKINLHIFTLNLFSHSSNPKTPQTSLHFIDKPQGLLPLFPIKQKTNANPITLHHKSSPNWIKSSSSTFCFPIASVDTTSLKCLAKVILIL